MAKNRQIYKSQVNLNDIMQISQDAIMSRLNCHGIGKIIEFDAVTQTCTVQMMQIKQFANNFYEPAPITQVPLIIYGTQNAQITLPNPVGSICLLFFMDRNIDLFLMTGEMYTPETTRTHDFSDCIAITTFTTLNNPLQNYDNDAISIIHKRIIEEIAYTSIIKNYANYILLQRTNGVNTSTIKIDDLITIQNTAQNLGTLIQSLIQTIKEITITSNAVSTVSKNALDAVATNFAALLKETE